MKRKVSQHVIAHYWEDPLDLEMATHASILAWEIHGQRSLVGYSPWGRKESDTTERAHSSSSHKQKSQLTALRLLVSDKWNQARNRFYCLQMHVVLLHFHVRPPISNIDYFRDLHKLNIGMDCFTLVLYSKSGQNMRDWKKNAQVKARLSNSSEIFFFFILLPLPLKMLLPLRIFCNKTSCFNLSSQTLSANSALVLCYWNIISYFPLLVMALG